MRSCLPLLVLLAGCAQPAEKVTVLHIPPQQWVNPGVTEAQYRTDAGQCREKALALETAPAEQRRALYEACMQGRGYDLKPTASREPGHADVKNRTP